MMLSEIFHGAIPKVNELFLPTGTSLDYFFLARSPRLAWFIARHISFAGFT
jgi:hypothetical protein